MEMERLRPQINLILDAGERQVAELQSKDPEKAERIRHKMEALKVCHTGSPWWGGVKTRAMLVPRVR